jgi:dTDP-4-dehydrorhamnose reductase
MVGTALKHSLRNHDLITPRRYELNVANADQVNKFKADYIIHLASETDHEFCDMNPANCYFVNTIGTANMVSLAKSLGVPIIYVSTASVFDGLKERPYDIDDDPNPTNHYNKSKFFGELIALAYEKAFVVRAGWMFGGGSKIDKKFVNKIINKIKRGDSEIKVCDDCIGSPTYTLDLADCIGTITKGTLEAGVYHFTNCSEGISRYEFANEIINILNSDVKIVPCKIDDLIEEFPCKRTNYEVIKSTFESNNWRKALKGYIYANY